LSTGQVASNITEVNKGANKTNSASVGDHNPSPETISAADFFKSGA
jgi:hypothetical protein